MAQWIDPNTSGIYLIRCVVTKDFYIGSAINMASRLSWHRQQIKKGGGVHNEKVRQLARKHRKIEKWEMFPIERVPLDRLRHREKELIAALKPTLNVSLPRRVEVSDLLPSMTEWLEAPVPVIPVKPIHMCERCENKASVRQERYCSQCKKKILKIMRRDAYFVWTSNVDE